MKFQLPAIAAAASAFVCVVSASPAGAGEDGSVLQAGKWRSTTQFSEISIPGVPPQVAQMMRQHMARGNTVEYCLKPEDIRRPGAESLAGDGAQDCRYEEWSHTGGKMRATILCQIPGRGSMRTLMVGTGSSTRYSTDIDTTITDPRQGTMRMKGTVSGERLGAC